MHKQSITKPNSPPIPKSPLLLLILIAFCALSATYSIVNPLFESPDEVWHYEYVRWLVEGNGLPRPEDVGHAPWHQEGSQPPLYYILAAAITAPISTENAAEVIRYNPHAAIGQPGAFGNKNIVAHGAADGWPWRGVALAAHVARFFSILLGAITVVATYGAASIIFAERRAIAALAAAIVAFNPQFLFLSAAVNNDNLVAACSAVAIWFCVRQLQLSREHATADPSNRQLLLFGLLVGVAALSKLSGLGVAGLVGLTLMVVAWRVGSFAKLVRWGLIVGGVALAVAGWWYLRNWLLFGDPLALQAMFAILPRRPVPPTATELLARLPGIWRSFWGVWGWFNIVADEWFYNIYTGLSLIGLLGLALAAPLHRLYRASQNRARQTSIRRDSWMILLLLIWVTVMLLSLWRWAQMRYPQGRLLFPGLSAFAILLAWGVLNWFPLRWRQMIAAGLAVALFGIAVLPPARWIAPTYAAPDVMADIGAIGTVAIGTAAAGTVPNPLEVAFGSELALRGYALSASELRPGERLTVDLFWQASAEIAQDYSVFVHLTDESDILQVQNDSYPAAGALSTSDWPIDSLIPDQHQLRFPETVPVPARLRVDVGLYDFESGQRLVVGETNGADHWTIGYVSLLPQEGDGSLPHSTFINFDEQIALVGFEFDRRVMQPGETLNLTLWWEALRQPALNYKVFTHLILPPEATWAQMDSDPQRGAAPTSGWEPGQRIEDAYALTLPESAPEGVYFVEIGLYDPAENDRLMVNFSDKGIVLGQVRVGSEK